MFRRFVASDTSNQEIDPQKAEQLFRLNPAQLAALLEVAWEFRIWETRPDSNEPKHPLGHPNRRSDILGLLTPGLMKEMSLAGDNDELREALSNIFDFIAFNKFTNPKEGSSKTFKNLEEKVRWDHLIYAYLVENTRIYEIFRRVIREYRHGEKLGVPLASSQHWLRNTEELFYRDPAPFSIYSVVSYVRPDVGASRRNAYYRMFGMDLNHGEDDNKSYSYIKPETANREFVSTWEEFLREVWVGISNVKNVSGTNPTDDAAIADLARRLHDMLRTRRTNGNLSREEFFFVSMMSWFHLTVEYNSPIVASLRAEGSREEERLKKIAEKVKLPAHAKSYYFFQLADPMSRILTQIEIGTYNEADKVPALYNESSPVQTDMRSIITFWSLATGRNMKSKALPVAVESPPKMSSFV